MQTECLPLCYKQICKISYHYTLETCNRFWVFLSEPSFLTLFFVLHFVSIGKQVKRWGWYFELTHIFSDIYISDVPKSWRGLIFFAECALEIAYWVRVYAFLSQKKCGQWSNAGTELLIWLRIFISHSFLVVAVLPSTEWSLQPALKFLAPEWHFHTASRSNILDV